MTVREALTRFPEGIVMIWLPQVQLIEAKQLDGVRHRQAGRCERWLGS
jgi:23S rRNA A2030 N6-methylase RlmJ